MCSYPVVAALIYSGCRAPVDPILDSLELMNIPDERELILQLRIIPYVVSQNN